MNPDPATGGTRSAEVDIDVSEAAGLGEPAHIRVYVRLPSPEVLPDRPILCFAQHGGGYNRYYWDFTLDGDVGGGQATWHADRGWIFASIDHLGCGDSSLHDPARLTYPTVTRAYDAAVRELIDRLRRGAVADGFPKISDPICLGIGQSRGASTTVVQQARYGTFDGVGVLGYSAIHTYPKPRPGRPAFPIPFYTRDADPAEPVAVNQELLKRQQAAEADYLTRVGSDEDLAPYQWCFHYDDEDQEMVLRDMIDFPNRTGNLPIWASKERMGLTLQTLSPGNISAEAASILTPVLVCMGERDVADNPWAEPNAYRNSESVDLYVCHRMGHMHNFASTRELLWSRIALWGDWVRRYGERTE